MNKIHLYSCLALMVACGNPAKKDNMKEETTDKGLDLSAMDTSVRPQDDFYNYVNGGWMKTAKIPADKPSWVPSICSARKLTSSAFPSWTTY